MEAHNFDHSELDPVHLEELERLGKLDKKYLIKRYATLYKAAIKQTKTQQEAIGLAVCELIAENNRHLLFLMGFEQDI